MPKVLGCDAEEGRRVAGIYGKIHGEWKAARYGGGIGAHRKLLSRHSVPGHTSSRSVKGKPLVRVGRKASGPTEIVGRLGRHLIFRSVVCPVRRRPFVCGGQVSQRKEVGHVCEASQEDEWRRWFHSHRAAGGD